MNPRVNRALWESKRLVVALQVHRGVAPTGAWCRTRDNCPCNSPEESESRFVAHHCELKEFEFGMRWTFVLAEHKYPEQHAAMANVQMSMRSAKPQALKALDAEFIRLAMLGGATFRVDLDVYRDGKFQETFTFSDSKTEFNSYLRAENKMLEVMGVPIVAPYLLKEVA